MNERDVVRGYRAASEALDETPREQARAAILAAAARAVADGPRAVDRMRRWRLPLAAAAATVLIGTVAVLVATRPGQETTKLAATPSAETAAPPSADIYASEPPAAAPAAPPPAPRAAAAAKQAEAAAGDAGPAEPPVANAVASAESRAERSAAGGEPAGARAAREHSPAAPAGELAPAQWIERIVALRAAGRDDEADRELKRFRERHPDFRLPPAALRKAAAGR
jgi:hypothetical protein